MSDVGSTAEEPMVCLTLRWRKPDSNHRSHSYDQYRIGLKKAPALCAQGRPRCVRTREMLGRSRYPETGVKGTDGKIHAIEVRIFPEAARGTGEGQYPWDLMPDSIMTNATVGKVDQAPQGSVLHVTFKGTESEYTVGPEVPVLANGPGDISLLKPGVAVFVIALKHEDGKLTSARLYAEKDGIKPPM